MGPASLGPWRKGAPISLQAEGHCLSLSGLPSSQQSPFTQGKRMWDAQGPSRWGWMQQGLNPDSLLFSPFSGLRSYPLRGSHSLDDLLDRPGNSTASSDYWDGQSRSRTPSHIPSRTPSPAPTPLPSSRRSSMGSMGVASDVKVSPLLQPALNPGVGQWAGRPGNPPCHPLAGWRGPSQPSRSLPICAGKDRMGFLSPGWRAGGRFL